jgi:hypothetical protein
MPADNAPDRTSALGVLAAVGLAVCCGLPVLLSVAAGVTIAGVGLRSWLLVAAGLVALGAVAAWWVRRRRACAPPAGRTGRS